jgi:hypothetical protein
MQKNARGCKMLSLSLSQRAGKKGKKRDGWPEEASARRLGFPERGVLASRVCKLRGRRVFKKTNLYCPFYWICFFYIISFSQMLKISTPNK